MNKLSSELDHTAKNHSLEKRVQDLLESEASLKDQNEALRRGNRELMHQLQANTTAVAEKGGITEKEIKDTVQVALLNLQAEKKRYDELKVSSQTEKSIVFAMNRVLNLREVTPFVGICTLSVTLVLIFKGHGNSA